MRPLERATNGGFDRWQDCPLVGQDEQVETSTGTATPENKATGRTGTARFVERFEAFADHALRVGSGGVVSPPRGLGPRERRLHVRNTMLEDHLVRLRKTAEQIPARFEQMATSVPAFFDGAALLYYRDHAGSDEHQPVVQSIGNSVPASFGVVPGADGEPLFSVRGLAESLPAPFTYDVVRGATGFWVIARAAGASPKKSHRIVEDWVRAYVASVEAHASGEQTTPGFGAQEAPGVLGKAFSKAGRSCHSFIGKRIDSDSGLFTTDGRGAVGDADREAVEAAVSSYAAGVTDPEHPDTFFEVRDVMVRPDAGSTISTRPRYWVLLAGWGPGALDAAILDLVPAPVPALAGLVPPSAARWEGPARPLTDRIAAARHVLAPDGDPLYGATTVDGHPYLVREHGPQRVAVRIDSFDLPQLRQYATAAGATLGGLHVRTVRDQEGEAAALCAAAGTEYFVHDTLEAAQESAEQARRDHAYFREDLERGAFTS